MTGERLTLAGVFLVIAAMAGIRAESDRYISNQPEQKEEHQVEPLEQSEEHKVELPKQNDEHQVELTKQNIRKYKLAGQIAEFPRYSHKGEMCLAAADFDGDGDIDLAVMRTLDKRGKVFLYKNDGQGNYILDRQITDRLRYYFKRANDIAAADFDKDGNIDLAILANYNDSYNGSEVHLYKNDGQGNYISSELIAKVPMYNYYEKGVGLAAADFDGDNDIDLVTVMRDTPNIGKVLLFENEGEGNYVLAGQIGEVIISSNSTGGVGLAAADFDNDGDIDLAVMETSRNKHKVFLYTNEGIETLVKTQ
ncbi:VCBS repeat-containing protein [Candidatus Woesearchaeota archaeon]|nr:VCBS repeat-containing protein [Candidatus Woesearchaeota archaeon]